MLWAKDESIPAISSPTIHAIQWSGNSAIDSVTLQKRLSIKLAGPYNPEQVTFSRDIIESIYRDKGYADVRVSTATTTVSPHALSVHFKIQEGPLYHVGSIAVQGNHLIADSLIKRDLGLKSGEPFSQTKIYEANKALFLSGYFEAIDIHYSTAPAQVMDIQVSVKERPTRYIKGGFGYGTETKERLSLGYEDRNFFGNEKQFSLSAVHSGFFTNPPKYRTSVLQASLAEPHFLGTPLQAQTAVSEEWDDRLPYNSQTTAWRSSLSKKISDHFTTSLRYRFEGTQITRLDPSQVSTTPSFTDVSAIGPTLTFDNTNDPFLPTVGWRLSSLFEKGITLGVGNLAFQRYEAHAGRFDSLQGFTFFAGLQFSLVRPDHPGDTIPIFERYTLGGANTVRGYEQQELGARDAQGNPLGGNAFAVGNLEVRHQIYKKLYGVWFLDGGQLYVQSPGDDWPYIRAKSLGDFAYGTGPGLRFHTPVGAVRLEVGYKLNTPGDTDFLHRTAIDFSLGEVF
jgi:outer membrane protein insertion porin family